ncbi:hypothetical protein SAMN05443247_05444 [Bradyrhizobium erythrophlei]|nr:hypothetical protein SAMN05443247_05444 [Bradyrhizobium erythrophlei]
MGQYLTPKLRLLTISPRFALKAHPSMGEHLVQFGDLAGLLKATEKRNLETFSTFTRSSQFSIEMNFRSSVDFFNSDMTSAVLSE